MIISFVTTCMNRDSSLKLTLPVNIQVLKSYPEANITLLSYNSKGNIRDIVAPYIDNPQLFYYEEREAEHFSMSHAKNMVTRLANGDFIVNLDADNFLSPLYMNQLLKSLSLGAQYILPMMPRKNCGIDGRIGFFKEFFIEHKGYDESFTGWGYDDTDLVKRFKDASLKKSYVIFDSVGYALGQSEAERIANYREEDKDLSKSGTSNYNKSLVENRIINPNGFGKGIVYDKNNKKITL